MNRLKRTIVHSSVGIGLLLGATVLPAMAEQNSPLVRQGLPGRRISGGTRSECLATGSSVTALIPKTNLGETTGAYPSVYFIIPELENTYLLEFSLRDLEGQRVYEKSLNTSENRGVISIQLPPESLQTSQLYRWYLSVVCDAQNSFQNDV